MSHYYYIFSYCSDISTLPNLQELCIFDTLEILSALAVSIANLTLFHIVYKCLCKAESISKCKFTKSFCKRLHLE